MFTHTHKDAFGDKSALFAKKVTKIQCYKAPIFIGSEVCFCLLPPPPPPTELTPSNVDFKLSIFRLLYLVVAQLCGLPLTLQNFSILH